MNLSLLKNRLFAIEEFNHICLFSRIIAFFQGVIGKRCTLKNFYDLSPKLSEDKHYLGIQQIPVRAITGSVGRPNDYNARFQPLKRHLVQRWVNIAMLWNDKGWDAIQVFKIDQEYYVLDGHHRVSVANAFKLAYIDAQVWEMRYKKTKSQAIPYTGVCCPVSQNRKNLCEI